MNENRNSYYTNTTNDNSSYSGGNSRAMSDPTSVYLRPRTASSQTAQTQAQTPADGAPRRRRSSASENGTASAQNKGAASPDLSSAVDASVSSARRRRAGTPSANPSVSTPVSSYTDAESMVNRSRNSPYGYTPMEQEPYYGSQQTPPIFEDSPQAPSSGAGYNIGSMYHYPNEENSDVYDGRSPEYGMPRVPTPQKKRPVREESYESEPQPEKKGNALIPILAILLVLSLLLAAILVPDWEKKTGTVASFVAPVKNKIVSLIGGILPQKATVQSFDISGISSSQAPSVVQFTAVTTTKTKSLVITNTEGKQIYQGSFSENTPNEDVKVNSKQLIWTPSYTEEMGYSGSYIAYAVAQDGTTSEGVTASAAVAISTPKPEIPAIFAFTCDVAGEELPVDITFAISTNKDVQAVRVADDNGATVAVLYKNNDNSSGAKVIDNGDTYLWTVTVSFDTPYTGDYHAQYLLNGDLSFSESSYMWSVDFGGNEATVENEGEDPQQSMNVAETPIPDAETENAPESTPVPTLIPTPEPTPVPTPEPTPTPSPTPANTPYAALQAEVDESALPSKIGLEATVYSNGKKLSKSYTRSNPINMLCGEVTSDGGNDYTTWRQAGIVTFRGSNLRQNAAYGTVEVGEQEEMEVVWTGSIGSMNIDGATTVGVTAPGQALIVKWPKETRKYMNLFENMKSVTSLKEVIVAGQDGKIHFYNLDNGEETRNAIDIGMPSRGGLSLATNGTPLLGVGQYNSKAAGGKTMKNGYHLINLLDGKELNLIRGDNEDKNSNYSGFTGSALFDNATGSMIVGGMNGVLYVFEPGTIQDTFTIVERNESAVIETANTYQGYKTLASGQKKTNSNIDGSVAMYNQYVYYGDQAGVLQCVDINTLTPVWAVKMSDNIDSTPALDVSGGKVSLYIGNTVVTDKTCICEIACYNALTGEESWSYKVPDTAYVKKVDIGVFASPVVGKESISDLVIFTVTQKDKATVIALQKNSGRLAWQYELAATTVSSPVAVYSKAGDAWIIQADENGCLYLLNAADGSLCSTLQLQPVGNMKDVQLKASPAVYGNLLIVGAASKTVGAVYCVRIGPKKEN